MSKLIAVVTITAYLALARITFEPGDEVTGLSAVDVQDLKSAGALQDEDDVAADKKLSDRAEKASAAEFAKARKAVQSTQTAIEAAERLKLV